jgi:hypothetical protein
MNDSSDPIQGVGTPSPPSSPPQIPYNTEMELEPRASPSLSVTPTQSQPFGLSKSSFNFDLSSDPLTGQILEKNFSSTSHRLLPLNRKRQASILESNPIRTRSQDQGNNANSLILAARDLLIQAYSATKVRDEQARILDLVEIFREYTEHGRIRHTSTILASQVSNLEQATKRIETQAKLAKPTPLINPTTWANIAKPTSQQAKETESWTLVKPRNRAEASTKSTSLSPKRAKNSKEALSRRVTLLLVQKAQASSFSSIKTRNLINNAFKSKGIQGLVISTASLSLKGNIIVNTTQEFNADFLIKNEATIKEVLPLVASLKKGEPWYKVAIYGLPIREFDTDGGMNLVKEEIQTFNKGLTPIGNPYWATSLEKRESGQSLGTIIVSFPTEDQANRAIKNRLYIAGISAKVAKYIATPSTAQCIKCAGFGHYEGLCKRSPKCILCAENHTIKEHYCLICKKKGEKCTHLIQKCANCKETTHSANSKLCEVFTTIKNKAINTLT